MANSNFVVQNGLTVGPYVVFAGNGDIVTSGNITTTGSGSIASANGFGGLNPSQIYSGSSNVTVISGSIFGNISGAKVTEVKSTGLIISATTETTSTTTGALQVAGGASIAGNAYIANNLYIGSTSFSKSLTTPTIIAVDNGSTYAQLAMINTAGTGSSDFAAYADNGADAGGWVDLGVAGSTFNDANYTITKPQDGYVITRPTSNTYGGNLIIATSEAGSYNDIVFGVGSFSSTAEVARFHGNSSNGGYLKVSTGTSSVSSTSGALQVTGGVGVTGNVWIGGNLYVSNIFSVTTNTLTTNDPLVYFQSTTPSPYTYDIGFYSDFTGGPSNIYGHTGVVRAQSSNVWVFFSNVNSEPTSTGVNWSDPGIIYDTVKMGNLQVVKDILPTSNATSNIGSTSAWFNTIYGIATQAKYADLAENYQADKRYLPAQVLEFGGDFEVTLGTPDTKRVAGVVSTNPAHLMNGALYGTNVVPLALTGRVPCNVIGPVSKGDLMVSAGFGFAKTNNDASVGQVIGKALEDFTGAKGQIEVVVGRF